MNQWITATTTKHLIQKHKDIDMKSDMYKMPTWIICIFVAVLTHLFTMFMYYTSITYTNEKRAAINQCERSLPRDQFCDAEWKAFVVPKKETHVALDGTEMVIPAETKEDKLWQHSTR